MTAGTVVILNSPHGHLERRSYDGQVTLRVENLARLVVEVTMVSGGAVWVRPEGTGTNDVMFSVPQHWLEVS